MDGAGKNFQRTRDKKFQSPQCLYQLHYGSSQGPYFHVDLDDCDDDEDSSDDRDDDVVPHERDPSKWAKHDMVVVKLVKHRNPPETKTGWLIKEPSKISHDTGLRRSVRMSQRRLLGYNYVILFFECSSNNNFTIEHYPQTGVRSSVQISQGAFAYSLRHMMRRRLMFQLRKTLTAAQNKHCKRLLGVNNRSDDAVLVSR